MHDGMFVCCVNLCFLIFCCVLQVKYMSTECNMQLTGVLLSPYTCIDSLFEINGYTSSFSGI